MAHHWFGGAAVIPAFAMMLTKGSAGGGGGDPLRAYVAALVRFDGTHGGTSFPDLTGRTWTALNTTIDTSVTLIDGGAGKFLGPGIPSELSTSKTGLSVGSGDFCIEAAIRPTAMPGSGKISAIFSTGRKDGPDYFGIRFFFQPDGVLRCYLSTTSSGTGVDIDLQSSTGLITSATLSRVCVERKGATVRLFHEGSVIDSKAISGSLYMPSIDAATLGAAVDRATTTADQARYDGRMDEFRFTIGKHRYGGAYTPLATPFTY